MKNKLLIVAAFLTLGCLVVVVMSSQKMSRIQRDLEQERYNRMVAEEKLERAMTKVKTSESDVTNVENQVQSLQTVLEQEKEASGKLKTELDKMNKLKDVLEQQLKDALVTQSPALSAPPPADRKK